MQKIKFYFVDRNPALKDRKRLKGFIEKLFLAEETENWKSYLYFLFG